MSGSVTIDQVMDFGAAMRFLLLTCAVQGLAFAVFRSFAALELRSWHARRTAQHQEELRRAHWEVRTGLAWNAALQRGEENAPRVVLDDAELDERRAFIAAHTPRLWVRGAWYSLNCNFCQTFWLGLGLALWLGAPCGDAILTALTQAALLGMIGGKSAAQSSGVTHAGGCGGSRPPPPEPARLEK